MQLATAPIVYPSDTLAIAPASKFFETPLYWLKLEMKFIDVESFFVAKCLIYYANNSRQANESEP